MNSVQWYRAHPWARPPPPPFDSWSGSDLDAYVKKHTGVETKLADEGFTGGAIVELLVSSTAPVEHLIKDAVPSRLADRLSVLHLLRTDRRA